MISFQFQSFDFDLSWNINNQFQVCQWSLWGQGLVGQYPLFIFLYSLPLPISERERERERKRGAEPSGRRKRRKRRNQQPKKKKKKHFENFTEIEENH